MPEVGSVRFAQEALSVAESVLPAYRTKYSKRLYTQPQLLAVLCLMRYEDWTFRETAVRVGEHTDLLRVLGLTQAPVHGTLYHFMRRLDESTLERALTEACRRMRPPPAGATIAIDGTGMESGSISTYFVKRTGTLSRKHYLKWVISVDTFKQAITAQMAHAGPTNDTASLPGLVEKTRAVSPVSTVLADAEFDSRQNHDYIRNVAGAMSVIPATRNKVKGKATGTRAEMQKNFPKELYGRRALVETVFSAVKRKLSNRAPGRSLYTQRLQALLPGVSFNIYRLKPRSHSHLPLSSET